MAELETKPTDVEVRDHLAEIRRRALPPRPEPPGGSAAPPMTLHEGEFPIDAVLVARLIAEQLPAYAGLPLGAWPSTGTVHAIFRLGEHLAVRLPRLARWAAALEREVAWPPRLAPRVTLGCPNRSRSGGRRPRTPAPGRTARRTRPAGRSRCRFPRGDRRFAHVHRCRRRAGGLAPCARSPGMGRGPSWIHGDLMRPNLLVVDGRLDAVIDFGAAGVGDPAMDLVAPGSEHT